MGCLSSASSEILAFGSHCAVNIQPILNCFIPNFKLKCEDSQNIEADSVNRVVFNLHQIKRRAFFGTPVDYVIVSSIVSMKISFLPLGLTFKGARDLLIIMQLFLNYSVKGLKVMTRAIGKWFGILMMIRDGKSLVSSLKMTRPFLRYGRVARSVTKIGKVGLIEFWECVSTRSASMKGSSCITVRSGHS